MKTLGLMMGCIMGVACMALANEPAAQGGDRQPPPMRQGKGGMMERGDMMMFMRPAVVQQLELTSEQQGQIAAVMGSASNEMSSLRIKMQTLAKRQAELMGAENIDENAVLQLADEIGKIRSDTAKIQIKQMLAARKILTAAQRLKMRDMMKNFMGRNEGGERPGAKMMRGANKNAGAPRHETAPGGDHVPPPPHEAAPGGDHVPPPPAE